MKKFLSVFLAFVLVMGVFISTPVTIKANAHLRAI